MAKARFKFTEAELTSFGNFLLSEQREKNIKSHPEFNPDCNNLRLVTHADLENWKDLNKTK